MAKLQSHWGEQVAKDLAAINPKQLGRVGVLMGGRSAEREISLLSGDGVLNALLEKGSMRIHLIQLSAVLQKLQPKISIEYSLLCMAVMVKTARYRAS